MYRGYADTPNGQVHYVSAGEGPPLIVLGPTPRSSRMFLPLLPELDDSFRVIALDLPGFGNSDPPPHDLTMDGMAETVVRVMDSLRLDTASLFGLHTGNKVVAALASSWPTRVTETILCGKSHSLIKDQGLRNAAAMTYAKAKYLSDVEESLDEAQLRNWAMTFRTISEIWWSDSNLHLLKRPGAGRGFEAKVVDELLGRHSGGQVYKMVLDFDLVAAVSRITSRTLVLEITSADEDKSTGRQGMALTALLLDGHYATLPELERSGVLLHAGFEPVARAIREFLLQSSVLAAGS